MGTVRNPVFDPNVTTMVIDVVLWKQDVTRGELCKVGFFYQKDGKKIINIVPPFPTHSSAISKDEWEKGAEGAEGAEGEGKEKYDDMVSAEYLPCHFQSAQAKFLESLVDESAEDESDAEQSPRPMSSKTFTKSA